MLSLRTVSLSVLRRALAVALADEPLLRLRFDRALARRDALALDDAFRSLQRYPQSTRQRVEDTIGSWLFGDGPLSMLAAAVDTNDAMPGSQKRAATPTGTHAPAPLVARTQGTDRGSLRPEATMHRRLAAATPIRVRLLPSAQV